MNVQLLGRVGFCCLIGFGLERRIGARVDAVCRSGCGDRIERNVEGEQRSGVCWSYTSVPCDGVACSSCAVLHDAADPPFCHGWCAGFRVCWVNVVGSKVFDRVAGSLDLFTEVCFRGN